MKKVAVEEGLPRGLTEMLKNEGYEVISPYRGQKDVDAVIITGMSNNFMNIQDITTTAPVIEASGKTPEDIMKRLKDLRYH
ncbi:MAG: YkuS family protein [Desulfocucumaceae bacterium]